MFGVAGEAGDEAIMPLTRVGGKLGVATSGGGGDSFAITIQAIDQQSGAEFLRKNSGQIVNQLRAANNLNRGEGRIR
jgi:phage-related minor tail protein